MNTKVVPSPLFERFLADVIFLANIQSNGKAQSGVLIAASPVFMAMFKALMDEPTKREVRLDDMTSANCPGFPKMHPQKLTHTLVLAGTD